jgi:hypothetical protein
MSNTSFKTNPRSLRELLAACGGGKIQLPDFQRSWVWAEDRILGLIASISRAFPVGALMTLESKRGDAELFARRAIQGAPSQAATVRPEELLLDGQQRMTSLYQSCFRRDVVQTITPKNKVVRRWFYIDIQKALQPSADREDAIFAISEDRRLKTNFDKNILLDLSTPDLEYEQLMFPLNRVFDWDEWQENFGDFWIARNDPSKRDVFRQFKNEVVNNFRDYQVPVITLADDTSHEAVCLVFEKVNTGGKPLDAFELLTAMYAAKGHKLRDDWLGAGDTPGLQTRLATYGSASGQTTGVLAKVASTDFLQTISLLHTKKVRNAKVAAAVPENDLPAIRATRQSLLDLPLDAYLEFRESAERGYKQAARFLRAQHVYRVLDLPYQSQLVPLAAIFAELGDAAEHAAHQNRIGRWYWCGVFGELYGSAAESRFARDIVEVPAWLSGGSEPSTVREGLFQADRLFTMRTRLSAAYKGIHALLMRKGAKDFRSGQAFDIAVFFDEGVDIHHIFPEAWCKKQGINAKLYDTVINKTPLGYRTNRIIGGAAPSEYLARLEAGRRGAHSQPEVPPLRAADLDSYLASHAIPVKELRSDDFNGFMAERKRALLVLIEEATGHTIAATSTASEGDEPDAELTRDLDLQIPAE